jgi:DNA-binding HxlR family transcriptional regulator
MAGKSMATQSSETTEISTSMNHDTRMCPRYEHASQILGKRWTGLLIYALMGGPKRFCELTALVEGLSDRVLSDRLRELEAEGIVNRIVYPQIPVRVEYQLTEKGSALQPVVDAIQSWASQWIYPDDPASAEMAAETTHS